MDIYRATYATEVARKYIDNNINFELVDSLKSEVHKRLEIPINKSERTMGIILLAVAASLIITFFNGTIGLSLFAVLITIAYFYIRYKYLSLIVIKLDEVMTFSSLKNILCCSETETKEVINNILRECSEASCKGELYVELSILHKVLDLLSSHHKTCNKFK